MLQYPSYIETYIGVSKQWWDVIRKAAMDNNGHVEEPLDEVFTYILEDEKDLPQM